MSYTSINEGKKLVDLNHPRTISTEEIERDLQARFPSLLFPYMKQDHVAGVKSNVHAYCEKHQAFTRLSVTGARHKGTQWGCSLCANEHKGGEMPEGVSRRYNFAGYIGRVGVQSGIFRAVKTEFPDAIWEHRMENGKEIDIYVPSIQAGIEYNGNYYHSDAIQKDNDYHFNKTDLGAKERKLIFHVLTDEAIEPYTNLVNVLKLVRTQAVDRRLLGVKLKTWQIKKTEAKAFHDTWNYRRTTNSYLSCDLHIGGFLGDELVCVLSGESGVHECRAKQFSASSVTVDMLDILDRMLKLSGTKKISMEAHLVNPLEYTQVVHNFERVREGVTDIRVAPSQHFLNSRYELDFSLTKETATASIWDCGGRLYSTK